MEALDEYLFRVCYAGPTAGGAVLVVMVVATVVGSGWTMVALVPLVVPRRTRRFGAVLGATLVVCATVVFTVKMLVERTRPCSRLGSEGVRALVFGAPSDYSFPSGHAAGSFCVAAFFGAVCIRRARAAFERRDRRRGGRWLVTAGLLFGAAALIAYSRVYLGVHFPGDVAGGALIGGTLGLFGARVHGSLATGGRVEPE